jgi:hypothetical protein
MLRILVIALALLTAAAACGGGAGGADARLFDLLSDELEYVEGLDPVDEAEGLARDRYLNRLSVFELGARQSDNVELDVCGAGLPIEREALVTAREEAPSAELWDRYEALLDEIEGFLCREYEVLTLVGDRYVGVTGPFRVNQGDLFAARPCSASLGEGMFPSDFRESELWSDLFSPLAQPNFCADDDRLLAVSERRGDAVLQRRYFYELPLAVTFNELREEPQLITIEGYPAIIGVEVAPSDQVYVYAIEREPDAGRDGIMVFVTVGEADTELAIQAVAELLR